MANAPRTSENAATPSPTFETITVLHHGSQTLEDLRALKSDLEQPTITAARAAALGYKVDSSDAKATVDLHYCPSKLPKPWTNTFLVVQKPTITKDGASYDIVLSDDITNKLLQVRSGTWIALARSARVQGLSAL